MRVLFAAGGTGGHINPALAVAGEIRRRYPNAAILFVGTKEKMEARLVPAAGYDFKTIRISGFKRGFSPSEIKENLLTVKRMFTASAQAKKIIKEFKPDAVVGFGGYISGPVVRAAEKMGIPTAIHEQNAYPGVANKALARRVDKVMLTVSAAADRMTCKNPPVVTGMPVRAELLNADRDFSRAELGITGDVPLILSMGGSLGARAVNEAMVELIAHKAKKNDCIFIHAMGQYGLWVPDKLKEKSVDTNSAPNVHIREYIDDMARCLSAADLVIGRAGASSLSEIEALGKASILIPSPNVTENHQYHNAMALAEKSAAVLIEEKDLTGERLIREVDALLSDRARLKSIGDNAKKLAITNAQEKIADIVEILINKGQ